MKSEPSPLARFRAWWWKGAPWRSLWLGALTIILLPVWLPLVTVAGVCAMAWALVAALISEPGRSITWRRPPRRRAKKSTPQPEPYGL